MEYVRPAIVAVGTLFTVATISTCMGDYEIAQPFVLAAGAIVIFGLFAALWHVSGRRT